MDSALRALERRWRASGDPLERGRWLREMVRSGQLAAERVWAGRALGHAAAAEAVLGLPKPALALDQRLPRTVFRQTNAARLLVVPLPDEPLGLGALYGSLAHHAGAQGVHLLGRAAAAAGCRRVVIDVTCGAPSEEAALLARWAAALRGLGGWLALVGPTPAIVAWFAERNAPLGQVAPDALAEAVVDGSPLDGLVRPLAA